MIIVNKKISSFRYKNIKLKGGMTVPKELIDIAKNHKHKNEKSMYDFLIESKQWVDDTKIDVKKTIVEKKRKG